MFSFSLKYQNLAEIRLTLKNIPFLAFHSSISFAFILCFGSFFICMMENHPISFAAFG